MRTKRDNQNPFPIQKDEERIHKNTSTTTTNLPSDDKFATSEGMLPRRVLPSEEERKKLVFFASFNNNRNFNLFILLF